MKHLQHFFLLGTLLCMSWMSFILCQIQSQTGLFIYPHSQIEVQKWDKRLTAEDVFAGLQQLAQQQHINLYKIDYRLQQPLRLTIAEAIGDETAHKQAWGEATTLALFHANEPLNALANLQHSTPVSRYAFNDASKRTEVIAGFATLGLQATAIPVPTLRDVLLIYANEQLLLPAVILFIGFILLFYYEVVQRYQEFAVKKLHGFRTRRLLWQFALEKGRDFLFSYFCVTAVVFSVLYYYNGWQQVAFFVQLYLTASLLILIVYSSLLVSVSLFFKRLNIRLLLKKQRPIRLIQLINSSAKLLYIILFIVVTTISILTLKQAHSELARLERWTHTKALVTVLQRNNGSLGTGIAENDSIYFIGNAFKRNMPAFNAAGGILVSADEAILLPTTKKPQAILAVNTNYFNDNPLSFVETSSKKKLQRLVGDELLVVVPEQFRPDEAVIRDFFLEWFDFHKYIATTIYHEEHQLPSVKKAH